MARSTITRFFVLAFAGTWALQFTIWLMERADRRTIVAIAYHAGGYLTLFELPRTPSALAVRVTVSLAAAGLAAMALRRAARHRE